MISMVTSILLGLLFVVTIYFAFKGSLGKRSALINEQLTSISTDIKALNEAITLSANHLKPMMPIDDVEKLKEQIASLQSELAGHQSTATELSEKIKNLESQVSSQESSYHQLRQGRDSVIPLSEQLKSSKTVLEQELNSLDQQLKSLVEEISAVTGGVTISSEQSAVIKEASETIQTGNEHICQIREMFGQATNRFINLESQFIELESEYGKLNKR